MTKELYMANGAPSLIVTNGKIITMDQDRTVAQAVAIGGDRIVAIGDESDIKTLARDNTRIIDAGGKAVIPGLIDCHAHLDREGLKSVFPTLAGARSVDDILQRIEQEVRDAAPGDWIVTMPIGDPPYYTGVPACLKEGRFPTRWELDRVAPQNPVYIRPIWGFWRHTLPVHSVANTAALEDGGLLSDVTPLGNWIEFERDQNTGEINGVIAEWSFVPTVELVAFRNMPRFTVDVRTNALEKSMRVYNSTATTSVFEGHGVSSEVIQAYQRLRGRGRMAVRATLMYSPSWQDAGDVDFDSFLRDWGAWLGNGGLGDSWLRMEGIYSEIGPGEQNMLRRKAGSYTGWAGYNYDCGVPENRMHEFLLAAARHNVRVGTIRMDFLNHYLAVDRSIPIKDRRWIIGHLNTASPQQIESIASLGLCLSTQTNRWIYKEGHKTKAELGPGREHEIMPLRSLLNAGVTVAFATDNSPPTLFYPVWQAISRCSAVTGERIGEEEGLSRMDALECATINGARLTFQEHEKGSIEIGKLADLAILSADPLTCPEDEIKDIAADMTVVGGCIVYTTYQSVVSKSCEEIGK